MSGCSGGGKSALLAELDRRGFTTVVEPGRRIVEEELRSKGAALPWVSMKAFADRAIKLAAVDRKCAPATAEWVFFDRGLVDAAAALHHETGQSLHELLSPFDRYHKKVFLVPPWPEIYTTDRSRRHGLADAIMEYDRLSVAFRQLGYDVIAVPRCSVEARADFVLMHLA